jgi:hypothetical protein
MMSLIEQNQKIIAKYRQAGEVWPATAVEIARWAIARKLWDIHPSKVVRQCAEQIAEAMREEYISDPQGRRIRVKHAAPYELQGRLAFKWDDMRTATHEHMEISFAHQRQQIVGNCYHLKSAIDSYNENWNKSGRPIQGCFDFIDDLAELELQNKTNRRSAA